MKESKVILCSGGIGSGKSFVAKALSVIGIPSFDTDACAKTLYETDPEILGAVSTVAGSDIVQNGHLDKKIFAERIFADKRLLGKIEEIVHPAVIKRFEEWKALQNSRVVAVESAIMLQKPALRDIPDFILYIDAPVEERIARVCQRDSLSKEDVIRRMESQENFASQADYIIETNDRQPILPALIKIKEKLENEKN